MENGGKSDLQDVQHVDLLLLGLECALCVECSSLPGRQVEHQQAARGTEHIFT